MRSVRVRIRRPRHQQNARVLLAFALVIPAAGVLRVAGPNPVSLTAAAALILLATTSVYDAYRVVLVVTRYGIGVAGPLLAPVAWFAWGEILRVETDPPVVSFTTRSNDHYQLYLDPRAATFLASAIGRSMLATGRKGSRLPRL